MNASLKWTLLPRRGSKLRVLIVVRISTVHQDPRSLDDQIALCQQYVRNLYQGEIEFIVIRSQGSGEILDRAEYLDAVALVESGQIDVVIVEDLARICRRTHAMIFCEACEDANTRLIAINDSIDTEREDWRIHAGFASMKHEMSNADTSKRIRRTLRNRFQEGGVVQCTIWGYEKQPGAKDDTDLRLIESAPRVYEQWFARLRDGANYSEIADWLNALKISPGPYCRSPRWTCKMVARITHNCILKGWRIRNRQVSKRVNRTGRHRSVKADESELLIRKCPHLAVFSEEYFDETIRMVDDRNAKFKRHLRDGRDPRAGVPKKRSRWPGQHISCGICGRMMRYGGHGQVHHLLCIGAYEYRCWNGITVNGPFAAERIAIAVRNAIVDLPGFDATLAEKAQSALDQRLLVGRQERSDIQVGLITNQRKLANLVSAIKSVGHSPALLEDLRQLEIEQADLVRRQKQLENEKDHRPKLPKMEEVRRIASSKFAELAVNSPEWARWIIRIIPRFEVRPVRSIDGGSPKPRAFLTLDLVPLVDIDVGTAASDVLRVDLTVDLFDPPQRIAHRAKIMELAAAGLTQRAIAKQLGIHLPTVQRAVALSRLMAEQGLLDPYTLMIEPAADGSKMRRHRHPRYRFEPFQAFDPPQ